MADPGEKNVWRLDRQVSAALIVTLLLQAAGGFMWAGRASARIDELKHRVDAQATVAERLARLEEQAALTRESLNRIEDKLERRAERGGQRIASPHAWGEGGVRGLAADRPAGGLRAEAPLPLTLTLSPADGGEAMETPR
ncbi:hypothetical protein [Caulobacter sp. NIBR2454]|uniref:hypothetical protein n=1 Tax=Caulobacter sp. NIBR2454 TaxID=3015996 RepID=UPI002FC35108